MPRWDVCRGSVVIRLADLLHQPDRTGLDVWQGSSGADQVMYTRPPAAASRPAPVRSPML